MKLLLVDLPPGAGVSSTAGSMSERLNTGFVELAGRFAEQFAAAKAKHLIHYNVNASNLSLDGAWFMRPNGMRGAKHGLLTFAFLQVVQLKRLNT